MVTENKEVAASTNYYTIWIDDNIVHGDAETDDENTKKIYKRRATNASVTQTYGSAYSASFTLPCSNYYVDIGRPFVSMVLIKEKNNVIFFGRVIEKSYSFDKSVTYECEGAQAFLNDKIYPVFDYSINNGHLNEYLHYGKISTNDLFANIMIHYNENVDNDHKIYYEFSKSKYQTLYNVDIERDTVYNVLKSNCIDIDGGYLVMESDDSGGPIVNKLYWRDYPSTNSADTSVIRYGLNLVDLNQRFDLSQLHTVYCVRFGYDNGERDKDGNIKEEDKENWTYLTYEDENIINKYGLTGEKYIDLDFVERGRKIEDDEVTTKEKLEDDEEYMNRIRETIRIQYESENKNAISINANVVELTPLNVNVSKSSDEVKYATPIKLGEIIKIDSPYHTILDDLPISSIQYDLLSLNKSLTIGALEPSLGKIVAREANFKEEEGGDEKDKDEKDNIIVEELNVTANGTYTAEENHAYNPVNVNVGGVEVTDVKAIATSMINSKDSIYLDISMVVDTDTLSFMLKDEGTTKRNTSNASSMVYWNDVNIYQEKSYPPTMYGVQNRFNSSPMAISKDGKYLWITINKGISKLSKYGSNEFKLSNECKTLVIDLDNNSISLEIPGKEIVMFYDNGYILLQNVRPVPWIIRSADDLLGGNTGYMYGLVISYKNQFKQVTLNGFGFCIYDMNNLNLLADLSNPTKIYTTERSYYQNFIIYNTEPFPAYPQMIHNAPLTNTDKWYILNFNGFTVDKTYEYEANNATIGYSQDHDFIVNRFYNLDSKTIPFAYGIVYNIESGFIDNDPDGTKNLFRNLRDSNFNYTLSYNFYILNNSTLCINNVNIPIDQNIEHGNLRNQNLIMYIDLIDIYTPSSEKNLQISINANVGTKYQIVVLNNFINDSYVYYNGILYILFDERIIYDGNENEIGHISKSILSFELTETSITYKKCIFVRKEILLSKNISNIMDYHMILVPGSYILIVDKYGDFLIYDIQTDETYYVNFLSYIRANSVFPSPFTEAVSLARSSDSNGLNSIDYIVASSKYIITMVLLKRPVESQYSTSYGIGIYKMKVEKGYTMTPSYIGYAVNSVAAGEVGDAKIIPQTAPESIIP